jgi:tetratricopeptide (TPR) repeat protein
MSDAPEETAEALREQGKLAEAAAAFRRRGDLQLAETLYAELWDFHAAADVARERGDKVAELGHLLSANDATGAALVGQAVEHGSDIEVRRAATLYERHRRWLEGAMLRERLGELPEARELYRRGGALLEVARVERMLGRLREAGLAYEQLLSREPEGDDAARAHLALGQLLLELDRVEEAAHHAQAAARLGAGSVRKDALAELTVTLDRLGFPYAADVVLEQLRAIEPATPARAAFIAQHRIAPASGPTRLGGRYEIERLLGAGATGRVFLARDALSGRAVAVKALAPQAGSAPRGWQRFFAEARLAGTLRHPNVVEILDVDEAHGLVVMEYLPGGTLLDRLHGAALPPRMVQRMMLDVLDGLAAVHARGIVHRDLKPANLFFTATGQVRIGDFGSAHLFAEEATQTAGFVGTLAYMAPEQMTSNAVGAAADLYSLGALAYHALTGVLPFPGPDFVVQHLGDAPPRPSARRPTLDPAWDIAVLALLAKVPAERTAKIDDVRRVLDTIHVADDALARASDPSLAAPDPARPRFVRTSALPDGAGGPIALGMDTRLGRPVVLETLSATWLASDAGQRHLLWLRELARLGGPRLQRVYALLPREDGGQDAVFEALPSSTPAVLDDIGRHQLTATLASLHAAGIAHGSLAVAITHEPYGPMLRIAGLAPTSATPDDDRLALAAL